MSEGEVAHRMKGGIDQTYDWKKVALKLTIEHPSETSLYMYLDGENVRRHLIRDGKIKFNEEKSPFLWLDLFASGPMMMIPWTSAYSETGTFGEPGKASAEKGERAYLEAVRQLISLVEWWRERPRDTRQDKHRRPATMPMPWGQESVTENGGAAR